MAMFHNPYNFIPAPSRKPEHEELGDHKPAGHDRYGKKLWSGRISVSLVSASPLLVPDSAGAWPNAKEEEHKHFPLRIGADGMPYIPPTSIKGMLRSAYEAVTNSRMGILDKHDKRLGYRMPTSEGLTLVPARIEGDQVVLYNGTSQLGPNEPGTKINGQPLMYAAWAERNEDFIIDEDHEKKVWAYLRLWGHGLFYFWNVETFKFTEEKPTQSPDKSKFRKEWRGCRPVVPVIRDYQPEWRQGYICATGFNIKKKHDERFFFKNTEPYRCPLTDKLREQWRALIDDYIATADAHDLVDKNVVRSRHVLNAKEERELSDGTLCYARVDKKGSNWQALALYPVSISRKLHDLTPADLIPANLRTAASSNDLSPADRVFGWAHSNGNGAYRGQLRIGPVTCHAQSRNDAIDNFGDEGVPLAILGQPKPQQVRFYVAKSVNGEAQDRGIDKEGAGYRQGKGIRGRKVYPHHASLRQRHWENPLEDRTQTFRDGAFQEYRRPHKANLASDSKSEGRRNKWLLKSGEENEQRDKQNRSITEWVKPGVEFSFEIDVINLSDVELGALLWLLNLPERHYHRFGGGKPLGFGSVRLTIHWGQTRLSDGESWRKYYEVIDEKPAPDEMNERAKLECIEAFKRAVGEIYGDGNFEQAPMIKAFLKCAKGFNAPIHYPRAYPNGFDDNEPLPPHPEGRAFEWFVANEQIVGGKLKHGHGHALPDLEKDDGLPVLQSK